VDYLIQNGHREIGMIAGEVAPIDDINRVRGYRVSLIAHDIPFREEMVMLGLPVIQHGYESTKVLIKRNPEITAIFCYNDLLAMGAIKCCKEMGIKVPGDIAIIGFDNIIFSELIEPPLTTIHMDKYEIGKQSAALLLKMLKNPDVPYPTLFIDTELIIRESA
jgi:DNA-binding LacI/PurR family transcriptional regulator